MRTRFMVASFTLGLGLTFAGCGDSGDPGDDDVSPTPEDTPAPTETPDPGSNELTVPDAYSFQSRFSDVSSVSYSGQSFRHVLVADMKSHIAGLTDRIDSGAFMPAAGDVVAELNFYYEFDASTSGDVPVGITTSPALLQSTYGEITTGKSLKEKVAGNDAVTDHQDWFTAFKGWNDPNVTSPDSLLQAWFQQLDDRAVAHFNGDYPKDPAGANITTVHLTADGHDLKELIQKFLDGAIAYSQGTDDYLDDATEGKGLLSDNTAQEGSNPFTTLEHAWDEGFGYFGATRDYGDYTDEELAAKGGRDGWSKGYHDTSGDGFIDLLSEYNFGHSTNAAKRDLDSAESAPTDFTAGAWEAFLTGRAIITAAGGALSEAQLADLQEQRDLAVENWENAIASTIVHYINEVLQDIGTFGTEDYRFADHAKHWSELKGFALGLQFNPRSALTTEQFETLHGLLGDAPLLPGQGDADAYKAGLLEARDLLQAAYGFDAANMGDSDGLNGW